MRAIEADIVVHGTPADVWSVLTDFPAYPTWNPFIREASGAIAPGARLQVRIQPPGGSPMTFRPTVRVAAPGRELRWLGHLWVPRLFDGEHAFRMEPVETARTRFRQSEEFRGILVPLMPRAMYERIRRGFEDMNRALKDTVERRVA